MGNFFSLFRPGLLLGCWLAAGPLCAQPVAETIRLNQLGFYPNAAKVAILVSETGGDTSTRSFQVMTADGRQVVFNGLLSHTRTNPISGKLARTADFSALRTTGTFRVNVPGLGHSYPFAIREAVHRNLAIGALKSFYFQRASTDLPEPFAGRWHRPAGHPDQHVLIHPSAASATRPAGTTISSPRGWYDAGDYNKYIVNSGISMGTLLSLYEDYPDFCKLLTTNIPESNNALPDLLDESLWNLRWMLTMQDPTDGGVYHKLTNPRFDGMVMPSNARPDRYVVQKSVTAALDFAAVMAQASRVFKDYANELPGLADSCRTAAVNAWQWARQNPNALYDQDAINNQFDPDVSTGTYGDRNAADEWIWAAAELYLTTRDETYYTVVNLFPDDKTPLPSWPQVRTLAYYSLARLSNQLTPRGRKDLPTIKNHILTLANTLRQDVNSQAFQTPMGKTASDYSWGSSAVAANQGIALLQAYRLTNDKSYLAAALANLDYLLGRNAVGYSFVTGFGSKTPMHPHHRPSIADGVEAPVPGLLSGGPNANAARQDKCAGYTTTVADEVFLDADCSYASNEIAINWNAPLVYLVTALEALQHARPAPAKQASKGRTGR
ncbi:glycoside hydrolase family 9 protein [Fibrella sp. HMF5335]|uniref:Endoglucanase n=1 Tax=Fibrella rubiginis TaxID=2817060 RepID=A0A939K3T2_9BACT|nr:glycoside hydrolase family 9 protein [Fibrella rubiginis]MBO0935456.1 glycoside hydrolase family 9 protein [Fibrella rubiginis]